LLVCPHLIASTVNGIEGVVYVVPTTVITGSIIIIDHEHSRKTISKIARVIVSNVIVVIVSI
jgi:hypothetical protein